MGRHKQGKPRRQRPSAAYSLCQLQPPGEGYEEWIHVPHGMDASHAVDDPELTDDARDLMVRMARLGPLYDYELPMCALNLDTAIDTGKLGLILGDNEGVLVTVEELAGRFGRAVTEAEVRESIHRLHADGAMLVQFHEDTPLVRIVAKKPKEPGDPWLFHGAPECTNLPSVCIPSRAREQLTLEQLGALMYMRAQHAALDEPDPEAFGQFDGIGGPAHARRLFAEIEATGWLNYRGCEACPAGHLCSRSEGRAET
ncbi:hypothetical protein ACFY2W_04095 [Streptomyces sp. NPDC001262]|uniref:hypothetical protein n=1 Tax=Streptomyces sp. NPDC001262 TaxID=3364552 RepID=UPI00368293A6